MRITHWITVVLITALLVAPASGCIPKLMGSGNLVEQTISEQGFARVEAHNAFQVQITRGDAFLVKVVIDDNLVQYLRVERKGDTLVLGMESGHSYSVGEDSMRATIQMPKLIGVDASGASQVSFAGFARVDKLTLDASGASQLSGKAEADRVAVDSSGASQAKLTGSGQRLDLEASGASQADLEQLVVTQAQVSLSGASSATVHATDKLGATASGASDLTYLGDPKFGDRHTSGASSIHRK